MVGHSGVVSIAVEVLHTLVEVAIGKILWGEAAACVCICGNETLTYNGLYNHCHNWHWQALLLNFECHSTYCKTVAAQAFHLYMDKYLKLTLLMPRI